MSRRSVTSVIPTALGASERALAACTSVGKRCSFNDGSNLQERYLGAMTSLRANPIKANDGSPTLTADLLASVAAAYVGDDKVWADLADLLTLITSNRSGSYANYLKRLSTLGPPSDNQEELTVYLGTTCGDGFLPVASDVDAARARSNEIAPRFGGLLDFVTGAGTCAIWPIRRPAPTIRTPVLEGHFVVVSALLDARTPTEIAKALATRHGASFVTFDAATHSVYGTDRCVDAAVTRYLIDLKDPGTVAC